MEKLYDNKNKFQRETVELFKSANYNGGLGVATRVGKTKIIIDTIEEWIKEKKQEEYNILWVVPTTILRDTQIKEEFQKWDKEWIYESVKTTCYASLKNEVGNAYDIVILDESHHITEKKYEYVVQIDYDHLMAITATEPEDLDKQILLNKLAPTIRTLSVDEAVDNKIISPYEFYIVNVPLDNKHKYIEAGSKKNRFFTTEFSNYNYLEKNFRQKWLYKKLSYDADSKTKKQAEFLFTDAMRKRADFIYNAKSKLIATKIFLNLIEKDKNVLVLTQRIDVADELCENAYHSKNPKKSEKDYNMFLNGEVNQLAACTGLDEGVTLPDLDYVVIHQAVSKKKPMIQRMGRALGLKKGHVGRIVAFCLQGTQDEKWVKAATSELNNVQEYSLDYFLNKIVPSWKESKVK